MKNNELTDIWKKGIDEKIINYTKEELHSMLLSKAKASIRKFYSFDLLPILFSAFLFYLVVTSISRLHDTLFVIGNALLAVILITVFILNVISFKKMNKYDPSQSMKDWLKYRIDALEKSINAMGGYILSPTVFLLTAISVNVYIQNRPYLEVITSQQFMVGFLIGAIVAAPIIYLINRKSRKIYAETLDNLRELYNQIKDE